MITRRNLLKSSLAVPVLLRGGVFAMEPSMSDRIAATIREYDAQGIHRTGTDVDNASADWLAARIRALGATPEFDEFTFKRVEVRSAHLSIGELKIEGVPLYDCTYTDARGITGSLGEIGSDAKIGVAMTLPLGGGPAFEKIEAARRDGKHAAIVLVTDEQMPEGGAATLNAESFVDPYGPPVLQVPHDHWDRISAAVTAADSATVVAHCDYVPASARNVQATVPGRDTSLAPVVVMTPRSGWWRCASERGGGIAAFLEIMKAVKEAATLRDVIFTANTGHELGHTGLDHYLESVPDLPRTAHMWIHLGANFAARLGSAVRLQYSDQSARDDTLKAIAKESLSPAAETPMEARPLGEARNIHDAHGRFVSILGGNGLFHHPLDTWPDAVDLEVTTKWTRALADLSVQFSNQS